MMNQQLLTKLMHVSRRLNQLFNKRLKPFNIRLTHYRVLHHIYENEGATQNELAEIICVDKITMTKLIEKLIQEGYVEKQSDRVDKRYNSVYSTDKAKENQEDFRKQIDEIDRMLQRTITKEESKMMLEIFDRLVEYMEDEMN